VIVSVFVRRLKEGRTFADFVAEWEADEGFGVPTRVFNAQSVENDRDVISIGFVDIGVAELQERLAEVARQRAGPSPANRHGRRVHDSALHVRAAH
jgi:hypothetical protein